MNAFQLTFTCSKSTIETLEKGIKYVQSLRRSCAIIVKFEHICHLILIFLLWTLHKYILDGLSELMHKVFRHFLVPYRITLLKLLTVCYYYDKYEFQSESTLYSCLNVKEPLARNRRVIWRLSNSNGIWTHNHLVRSQTN